MATIERPSTNRRRVSRTDRPLIVSGLATFTVVAFALLGPILAPRDPAATIDAPFASRSSSAIFGTDRLGRDVWSRLLHGGRTIVVLAVLASLVCTALGTVIGAYAGWRSSRRMDIAVRILDLVIVLPPIVVLLVALTGFGASPPVIIAIVTLTGAPVVIRVVRAATQQLTRAGFIEHSVTTGEAPRRIVLGEIIPNISDAILVDIGLRVVGAIYLISAAGFLGFGPPPPASQWGQMVAENAEGLSLNPWAMLAPAGAIAALSLSVNFTLDRIADRMRTPRRGITAADQTNADGSSAPPCSEDMSAAPRVKTGQGDAEWSPANVAEVSQLTIVDTTGAAILHNVSVVLARGTSVAVVGESGSGKTTLALALLGHIRPGLRIATGSVRVQQVDMLEPASGARHRTTTAIRRSTIGYLGQDPAASLCPTRRIGAQITDVLIPSPDAKKPRRSWPRRDRRADRAMATALLASVGLGDDPALLKRFPHPLSGGQQQRVALARALANRPDLLVLDEPTTGLDPTTQRLVLDEVRRLQQVLGFAVFVVTHDLGVAASMADEIVVLADGQIVEAGPCHERLQRPRTPELTGLVRAYPDIAGDRIAPSHRTPDSSSQSGRRSRAEVPTLVVDGLRAGYPTPRGPHLVADDVSFTVSPGECLALVGQSGTGKSTIARCLVGLHRPWGGTVSIHATELDPDVHRRSVAQRAGLQLISQNPADSLNPRRTALDQVSRPFIRLYTYDPDRAREAARDLLDRVRLAPSTHTRRPSELSGGERQRVAIARALAAGPSVLVCDEITSSLDMSVQASLLDIVADLQASEDALAVLFITHDLGIVRRIADRVLVLDQCTICEQGPTRSVLDDPQHHVTRSLVEHSLSLPQVPQA